MAEIIKVFRNGKNHHAKSSFDNSIHNVRLVRRKSCENEVSTIVVQTTVFDDGAENAYYVKTSFQQTTFSEDYDRKKLRENEVPTD